MRLVICNEGLYACSFKLAGCYDKNMQLNTTTLKKRNMSNQKMLECYDAAPLDKRFWFAVEGISLVFLFCVFRFLYCWFFSCGPEPTMAIKLWVICSNASQLVLGAIREVFYADFYPTFEVEEGYCVYYLEYLVNRDNCKLVFNNYHLRMKQTCSLESVLDEFWQMIGYVQFGNVRIRNESDVGEIDLNYIIHL